jgi:hypothetical protein
LSQGLLEIPIYRSTELAACLPSLSLAQLDPNVLVTQSTKMWLCKNPSDALNFAGNRRARID